MILGHEFMGIVEEIGRGVTRLQKGDRVVVPFPIACGRCFFCNDGLPGHCENSNPENTDRKAVCSIKRAARSSATPICTADITVARPIRARAVCKLWAAQVRRPLRRRGSFVFDRHLSDRLGGDRLGADERRRNGGGVRLRSGGTDGAKDRLVARREARHRSRHSTVSSRDGAPGRELRDDQRRKRRRG